MTHTDTLLERRDGKVLHLTLNRPERHNALDFELLDRLIHALHPTDDIAVVILDGAGHRAFSAGFDVTQLTGSESDLAADDAIARAAAAIQNCPAPVVAAIRGHCYGGAFDLAMACDLRVASSDAHFALPAVRLGVVYRYDFIADLIQFCGLGRARDLLFAMPALTADQALAWGFLTEVIPAADLDVRVQELAIQLAAAPLSAVRGTKETIRLLAGDRQRLEDIRQSAAQSPERTEALQALRKRLGHA